MGEGAGASKPESARDGMCSGELVYVQIQIWDLGSINIWKNTSYRGPLTLWIVLKYVKVLVSVTNQGEELLAMRQKLGGYDFHLVRSLAED